MADPIAIDFRKINREAERNAQRERERVTQLKSLDDPNAVAEADTLAQEAGVHPFVPRDPEAQGVLKKRVQEKKITGFHGDTGNRHLSQWLGDPENAAIAFDQTDQMEKLSDLQNSYRGGNAARSRFVSSREGDEGIEGDIKRVLDLPQTIPQYFEELGENLDIGFLQREQGITSSREVWHGLAPNQIAMPDEQKMRDRKFIKADMARLQSGLKFTKGPMSIPQDVAQAAASIFIPGVKQVAAEGAVALGVKGVTTLAKSPLVKKIPGVGPFIQVGATVAQKLKTPAQKALGTAILIQDAWHAEMGIMAEQSWAENPPTADYPRDDPRRLMSIAVASLFSGSLEAVSGAIIRMPLKKGFALDRAARRQFGKMLTDRSLFGTGKAIGWASASEGGTETIQELAAIILIQWQQVSQDAKTVDEALDMIMSEETAKHMWNSFKTGAGVGGFVHGAGTTLGTVVGKVEQSKMVNDFVEGARNSGAKYDRMEEADKAESFLDEMEVVLDQLSTTEGRSPEKTASMINDSGADGGVTEVKIPAFALNIMHQEEVLDVEEFFDLLPEGQLRNKARQEYEKNLENGGDVTIPLGEYAVHILRKKAIHDVVSQHLRLKEEAYSQAEAADALRDVQREAEGASERSKRVVTEATAKEKSVREETDKIFEQLVAATPQLPRRKLRDQARVVGEMVVNLAERTGHTVEEVAATVGPLVIKQFTGIPEIDAPGSTLTQPEDSAPLGEAAADKMLALVQALRDSTPDSSLEDILSASGLNIQDINGLPAFETLFTGGEFRQLLEEAGRGEELKTLVEGAEAFEEQAIEQDLATQARRLDSLIRNKRASLGQGARGTDQFPNTGAAIENIRGIGLLSEAGTLTLEGDGDATIVLDDLHQSTKVSESAQRAVFKALGLPSIIGEDTNEAQKIYELSDVFGTTEAEVEANLRPWLDEIGWDYELFGPKTGKDGKAFFPVFIDENGNPTGERTYADNTVWIFNPAVAAGSFMDAAYTLAWRVTHEIAHGIVNERLTAKYGGDGRRAGALGVVIRGPFHKRDEFLSLADALRAVEWEHETFIEQRRILEEVFGVVVTDEQFRKENAGNLIGAVYRAITGQFADAGDIGIQPTALNPDQLLQNGLDLLRVVSNEINGDADEIIGAIVPLAANILTQPDDEPGPGRRPPKGFYVPGRNTGNPNTIGLGVGADLSTFLHEAVGHYAVHVLDKMSQLPNANPQLKKDYDALLRYGGVKKGDPAVNQEELEGALAARRIAIWANSAPGLAEAERRINHANRHLEKIARAAEQYLASGVAPSVQLRGVFERMQTWFIGLYQTLANLATYATGDQQLPEDVVQAFDRIIASDAAIKRAKSDYQLQSAFLEKPDFMSDKEWDDYTEKVRAHDAQARALYLQKQMKELKRKERGDQQDLAKVIEAELRTDRVQQAREWLGTGVWIGEGDGPDAPTRKLDRSELVKEYGKRILRELPGGRDGVVSGERAGGLKHWDVATMFDLTQEELVEGLKSAELLDRAVESAMREQQDVQEMTPDELADAALQSLNDAGAEVIIGDMAWARKLRDQKAIEERAATDVAEGPAGTPRQRKADVDGAKATLQEAKDRLEAARQGAIDEEIVEAGREVAEADTALEMAVQRRRAALPARRGERAARQGVSNARLLQKVVRARAELDVAQTPIGTLRPDRYSSAERRAGEKISRAVASKDWDAMLEAKADQLYNHYAFRASVKALDKKRKIQNRVRRLTRPNHLTKVEVGGKQIADHILSMAIQSKLITTRRDPPTTEQGLEAFAIHMADEEGVNFAFDAAFIADIFSRTEKGGWREMTLEELLEMDLAIVNLDHIGFEGNKVFVNGKNMAREDFVTLVDANTRAKFNMPIQVVDIDPNAPPVPFTAEGIDLFREKMAGIRSYFVKMETFAKFIDHGEEGGPAWQFFGKMQRESQHLEHQLKGDWGEDINGIFEVYTRKEKREFSTDKFHIPETGRSFTMEEMMMIALNMGNVYQREAMMNGWQWVQPFYQAWTEPQLQAVLKKFDEDPRHIQTVHDIWNMIEKRWPMIKEHEMRVTGRAPEQVISSPYTLDSGTVLKGGYFPLIKDPKYSEKAERENDKKLRDQQFGGGNIHNSTQHGFTRGRKNFGKNIPLLDMKALYQHMNEVSHDTAQRKFVMDALKIIQHPTFERLILDLTGHKAMLGFMRDWVRNIAGDNINPTDPFAKFLKQSRIGANSSIIGLSATTVFVQPLALANAMTKVGVMPIMRSMSQYIKEPGLSLEYAMENSKEIPHRMRVRDREVNDLMSQVKKDGGRVDDAIAAGYYFVGWTDVYTAAIAWQGFIDYGINNLAMSEAEAIDYADSLIPQTQGSGAPKDQTRLQAMDHELAKQFTVFYTYWSSVLDLYSSLKQDVKFGKISKMKRIEILFWWMVVTPAISEIILGRAPDFAQLADPDDHEWLKFFGWTTVGNFASMIPHGQALVRVAENPNFNFELGTGLRVPTEIGIGLSGLATAVGGEPGEGLFMATEHFGKAAWMQIGLPGLVQGERFANTLVELSQGNAVSPRLPLFGRNK